MLELTVVGRVVVEGSGRRPPLAVGGGPTGDPLLEAAVERVAGTASRTALVRLVAAVLTRKAAVLTRKVEPDQRQSAVRSAVREASNEAACPASAGA